MWDFGRDRCVIVVVRVSCEGLLCSKGRRREEAVI